MKKQILFVTIVIILSSGCNPTEMLTEKLIESVVDKASEGKAKVDLSKGSITIKGDDGETITTGKDLKLPNNFPKDVYIPSKAQIVSTVETKDGDYMLNFQLKESPENSIKKLRTENLKKGWQEKESAEVVSMKMISMEKGEKALRLAVLDQVNEDTVAIQMSIEKK